jgi:broad specificity phosphatase PhoE
VTAPRTAGRSTEPAEHVVVVRHGETEWTLSGQHTGRTDVPLTELGRHEAELLAARLAPHTFALVLSSPMSRALETCRLAGLGDAVVITEDLHEWDYGDYEGVRTVDIRRDRAGAGHRR